MFKSRFLIATGLMMIGTSASATIIAQEDFSYADGTLDGNGVAGAGWVAGWSPTFGGTGSITISGGAVTDSAATRRVSRSLTDTQGVDGTSVFIGLDHEFGTLYSAIEFSLGSTADINFRLQANTTTSLEALNAGGDILSFANGAGIQRYVIQIDYGVGDVDTATLFENGVSLGSISTTEADGFAFNQISFGTFTDDGSHDYTDNIVIATTFEEANVPEPTSLALLGLGGLLIARRRRG